MSVLSTFRHACLRKFFQTFCRLKATEFTAQNAPIVGFNCGDEEWDRPLNEWISTNRVIDALSNPKYDTRVWLYKRHGKVIGYGSLGTTKRPPPPPGPLRNFSIIPYVAVQLDYQGRPKLAARDERYAGQIMNDLIFKARQLGLPVLILYVHPKNERAKRFYRKYGFQCEGPVRNGYDLMGLRLS